ncbi:2-keto-4-pentenoate hydratase [Solicola gregarius]|uniref:Fumarylacetoacetate hydrolase family protein n=1 Tax=Solicola gregarius TaxID=2908642 RepID=A0AA46TIS3_9ACTN|nr:fumarylacetoacetate hydrolase family protein [Solicola gregarius]UYM06114.1 fumarylacetoacetate hydrolase family protein [Solicola gregarius]
MTTPSTHAAADLLWNAWQAGETLPALPAALRPTDAAAAMEIQRAVTATIGPTIGWKVAATSAASQAYLGVDGPLPGAMHARFQYAPGESMSLAGQTMRVAEPEFAFRMGRAIAGDASRPEILDAVESLHVAVEVPDTRYADLGAVDGLQILADGSCTGSFVLGPQIDDWQGLDLSTQAMTIDVNGARFSEGSGAAALGDPRISLCWLVTELARFDLALRPGDIVTTGTAAPPAPVTPGDAVTAEVAGIAQLTVQFTS